MQSQPIVLALTISAPNLHRTGHDDSNHKKKEGIQITLWTLFDDLDFIDNCLMFEMTPLVEAEWFYLSEKHW